MATETIDLRGVVGVVLHTSPEWRKSILMKEVLYGLEEEQIPFGIGEEMVHLDNLVLEAYRAAKRSVFGVGICCAPEGIVIHHKNLQQLQPLFNISRDQCTPKTARLLGSNAARLIKGVPFEEI